MTMKTVLVSSLLSLAAGAITLAQSPGAFSATGNMIIPRWGHTATLLLNGKVLITGGFKLSSGATTASAEIYDPETGTFTATGSMAISRAEHAAILLPNGRVLIVGMNIGFN